MDELDRLSARTEAGKVTPPKRLGGEVGFKHLKYLDISKKANLEFVAFSLDFVAASLDCVARDLDFRAPGLEIVSSSG
jgi:hypothetical protein